MKRFIYHPATRLVVIGTLLLGMTACPGQNNEKWNNAKGAAYAIQHGVDGFKDTLATLQAANKLSPDDVITLAGGGKAVNGVNNELIDAAWEWSDNPNATTREKLLQCIPRLRAAIDSFINSGAVVKNRNSQAAIGAFADLLLKNIETIERAAQ